MDKHSMNDFENQVQQTEVLYGRGSNEALKHMKELEPSKISAKMAPNNKNSHSI
jgi:uncharacterized protein with PhoU and TrkA domain